MSVESIQFRHAWVKFKMSLSKIMLAVGKALVGWSREINERNTKEIEQLQRELDDAQWLR